MILSFPRISDEEYGEQSVSVMLDGEESEIMFVDHPADEMTVSAVKEGKEMGRRRRKKGEEKGKEENVLWGMLGWKGGCKRE